MSLSMAIVIHVNMGDRAEKRGPTEGEKGVQQKVRKASDRGGEKGTTMGKSHVTTLCREHV